ncbi:hypothetical protein HYH03_011343 [Edaphochlamys debaryana]|uniref:Uncharacterized protein n=1 Tax=Edaphochlamys debaryana TaxID=47281 RepID=A0A835XTZ8_9CHLO|nr:hypothetical protein HYH03_011343 [Edaphochlamys debaryana]|eukprot:KAG2490218.1 hypothetical protein HYH03_011343 [Edaphochlamys debaryana]
MDFWSLSAEVFGMPEAVSSFLDTTLLLFSDPAYGAADIPSDWRAAMSSASTGSYCSIPGTVLPTHMYYRTDIFAVHNISVPATWDELLTVAEALHGRDMDGDGLPEYGICMDTREVCGQYGDTLLMVLATLVQTRGPADGVVFDPDNLSLLATGEALAKAIQIYRGLIRFGPPPDTPCRSFYTQLLPQGRCLVAFGVPLAFKVASHASVSSRVSGGKLGTAPLPGSERVLDRPSGRLVPCTPERCPYAQRVARLEGGSSAQEVLANTVVAMDSISFAINRYSPPYRQAAAFRMLATLMSPAQQQERILAVNTEGGPFRASQLNLGAWVNAGYDSANARSFLAAYRAVLESPNVFYELRFPGVLRFKDALFQLARAVLWGNVSLAATDAEFRVAVTTVIQQQGGKEVFLAQYRKTLGIVEQKKRAGDEEDKTLTADVCQAAVSLHHAAIRTAAQQHRGYESATEGDSFILAFRSSHDCLRFCLRVQEALLALDWPPELLDSPYAATLAARHDPAGMQPWVRRAVGPSLRPLLIPPGAAKRNDAGPSDSRQAQRPAPTSAKGRRPVINSPAQPSGVGPSGSGSGSGAQDCPGILLASHRTARTCSSPVAPAGLLAAASEGQGRRPQSLGQHTLLGSIPQLQVVQPQDFPGGMLSPDDIWLLGTTGEFSALTGCEESRPGPQPSPDLKSLLSACWEETSSQVDFSAEPQDDARLLFRGLRVRMGFHRGVLGPCDVNTNQASQRVVYSGPVLQLARAIGDVGRGGQVLMSTAALASLNPQQLANEAAVVLHSGRHVIKPSDASSVELYSAPGVLEAPLGRLAVAVVQVEELGGLGPQGVMGLYGTLRAQAQHLAAELKGYLLLTGPGALQAVFPDPAAAARWCLQLVVSVQSLRPGRGLQQGAYDREQKAEVAEEHLSADPEAGLTFDGRLSYKGPAFKAAGSLAAHANWGEILVSGTLANAILGKVGA